MIRYRQVNALYYAILLARQKHHYIMIMMLCKQKLEEGGREGDLRLQDFAKKFLGKRGLGFQFILKKYIGK